MWPKPIVTQRRVVFSHFLAHNNNFGPNVTKKPLCGNLEIANQYKIVIDLLSLIVLHGAFVPVDARSQYKIGH